MLKSDTIVPGLEVPNLDNLSPEDLDAACDAFEALQKLAYLVRQARRYRLNGKIQDALDTEYKMDMAYRSLPQSMRY